ncbi:MAG TPA: ATP-dependent DNA ligase [Ilumatobacter sp.]|nr:ATP-dependent DNA ligase [Ilumatobacter sp.]
MLFAHIASTSQAVARTSKRSEKVAALAELFRRADPHEVPAVVAFATGASLVGRVGVGWATLSDVRPAPALEATLHVAEVAGVFGELARIDGTGSTALRRETLAGLLGRATQAEQEFVRSVIGGELRQGALDGVVTAAVAKAAEVPVGDVQRAAMFLGSLPQAARIALTDGGAGLSLVSLSPSTPVQPMLASPAASVDEALAAIGGAPASVEWKLDGARIQAHRRGGEVRLFTRNLNDITGRLAGVVDVVAGLPGGDLVLDGEVLGLDLDGAPRRFQDTMGDFGAHSKSGSNSGLNSGSISVSDGLPDGVPRGAGLQAFFFDVLHAGEPLVDEPLATRRDVLSELVPVTSRLPSTVTADASEAQRFLDAALAAGHEGVMVKDLAAQYEAGRRGGAWRKVKPVYTFDLVVLAVEWGHGRRRGWLSNLHLGARGHDGEFVMVGKTFKGLTDELLRWQTERFQALRIGDGTDGAAHVVHVQPVQVVEIAVDGVQVSSRYPGGVALRFARVRRYRDDKPASNADTIDSVQSLLRGPGR